MKLRKMRNAKIVLAVIILTGMLFFGEMFQCDALASTKATTPMNGWRYVNKTANYQVKSTSKNILTSLK